MAPAARPPMFFLFFFNKLMPFFNTGLTFLNRLFALLTSFLKNFLCFTDCSVCKKELPGTETEPLEATYSPPKTANAGLPRAECATIVCFQRGSGVCTACTFCQNDPNARKDESRRTAGEETRTGSENAAAATHCHKQRHLAPAAP